MYSQTATLNGSQWISTGKESARVGFVRRDRNLRVKQRQTHATPNDPLHGGCMVDYIVGNGNIAPYLRCLCMFDNLRPSLYR